MNKELEGAVAALLNYEQADMYGERCTTSRQAVYEVADAVVDAHKRIAEIEAENARLKAELEIAEEGLTASYLCGAHDAKADKWQPVETAPDNTAIIIWWPHWWHTPMVGYRRNFIWHAEKALNDHHVDDPLGPTHWQPLPTAPKGE